MVATVPTGTHPQDVSLAADGRHGYVAAVDADTVQSRTCIRYSRVQGMGKGVALPFCTTDVPLFVDLEFDDGQGVVRRPAKFGEPGCGVLHPACPRSVRSGAEDGGEMGCYHDRRYALAVEAARDVADHA